MKILLIVVLVLIFVIILIYNRIKTLQNKVKQSKSSIDVCLNQRFELIPNLVECVKGYAKYEKELLESITELRSKYNENKSLKDGADLNNKFNQIYMLQEAYPDLKANETFVNLQENLSKMESRLQAARRLYNGDVTMYNNSIATFPGNIFAKVFSFNEAEFFEIDELKKVNIDINL